MHVCIFLPCSEKVFRYSYQSYTQNYTQLFGVPTVVRVPQECTYRQLYDAIYKRCDRYLLSWKQAKEKLMGDGTYRCSCKHPLLSTVVHCHPLSPTVSHCHPLLSTVTHCHPLLSTVTHCHPLLPTVTHCYPLSPTVVHCRPLSPTVTHCCPLSPTVTHCYPLSPTVVHCRPLCVPL